MIFLILLTLFPQSTCHKTQDSRPKPCHISVFSSASTVQTEYEILHSDHVVENKPDGRNSTKQWLPTKVNQNKDSLVPCKPLFLRMWYDKLRKLVIWQIKDIRDMELSDSILQWCIKMINRNTLPTLFPPISTPNYKMCINLLL